MGVTINKQFKSQGLVKYFILEYELHVARSILIFIEKHVAPSPSYACRGGGFESAYHYFCICPNYNVTRERYLEALLRDHTTQELLLARLHQLMKILKWQDYILKSKTFVN